MDDSRKRIKILPDNLVDVIAAGEVVERPASVVKELVENAIDAGARTVKVYLEGGGMERIQVLDDGEGMNEDECLMAIERHATSKVASLDDLRHLRTLGFRGEALPSIASVGRFKLESWDGESGTGTRVVIDNGKLVKVEPVGRARGTTVFVEALFRKLPARRKFMKSRETETAWCLRAVEDIALTCPGISFFVMSGGATVLEMPLSSSLRDRVMGLWGPEMSDRLISLAFTGEGVSVEGLISPPNETFSRRFRHHTMINGRPVRDPVLNRVISSSLSGAWPAGRFPALVLSIRLDDELVDVNVHPAKREVRFKNTESIGRAIREAVRNVREPVRPAYSSKGGKDHQQPVQAMETGLPFGREVDVRGGDGPEAISGRLPDVAGFETESRRILGQVLGTYILVEDSGGLSIIDQHAAHERIVFNRLMAGRSGAEVPVQTLAVPLIITVSPSEMANLAASDEVLSSFGFGIAEFGPGTIRVTEVPSDLRGEIAGELLRQLAGGRELKIKEPEDVALAVSRWACRQSVMAGRKLSFDEMDRLVRDLDEAETGFSCPHGRPTRVTLSPGDLEKLFGRR